MTKDKGLLGVRLLEPFTIFLCPARAELANPDKGHCMSLGAKGSYVSIGEPKDM